MTEALRAVECLRGGGAVLVCGLPGHGKTTLAMHLAESTGAHLVHVDSIRGGRRLASCDYYDMARQHVDYYRQRGPVVIDACALSKQYRRALVGGIDGEVVCVWFRPDVSVVEDRRPGVDVDLYLGLLDPPEPGEGFEVVELEAVS